MTTRRALLTGLTAFIASPAIVRASSLMPVKAIEPMWRLSDPDLVTFTRSLNIRLADWQYEVLKYCYPPRGSGSLVERQPSKLFQTSSILVGRSNFNAG